MQVGKQEASPAKRGIQMKIAQPSGTLCLEFTGKLLNYQYTILVYLLVIEYCILIPRPIGGISQSIPKSLPGILQVENLVK